MNLCFGSDRSSGAVLVAVLVAILLATGCATREEEIHAIANGARGGIGGSRSHFVAEATAICAEMPKGETSIVPPLDKNCSRGCRCIANSDAEVDPQTTYDCEQWNAREWQLLRFAGRYALDGSAAPVVYFHHQASWHRTDEGCRLEFTAHGDLDEDGVYSTYATWTEATPGGARGNTPEDSVLWE